MPAYDSESYRPPVPLALVSVRSTSSGTSVDEVPMLLDSGADVTLLPRSIISIAIETNVTLSQFELEAFDGTKSFSPVVELELRFLGKIFRGQFLIIDAPHGILGRNILNSLSLVLDGPSLSWNEKK